MGSNDKSSAINPLVLAELVAGRRITWDHYADKAQVVCEVLNIPKNELFSGYCPIVTPYQEVMPDGTVKELNDEEALERLQKYLSVHTKRRITKTPPLRSLTLKTIRSRTPDLLIPMLPPQKDKPFPDIEEVRIPEDPIRNPVIPGISGRDKGWHLAGHTWMDMGEYFKETPEFDDPNQGALGDCYFISALTSVIWTRQYVITNRARIPADGDDTSPIHEFAFYRNGKKEGVEVSEKVLVNTELPFVRWHYAHSEDSGEIWPAVIEKAYAKWRTGTKTDCPNMDYIDLGNGAEACTQLIGGSYKHYWHSSETASNVFSVIKSNCVGKRAVNPMFAFTEQAPEHPDEYTTIQIEPNHSYSVLGWDRHNNTDYIVLRNPWGWYEAITDPGRRRTDL